MEIPLLEQLVELRFAAHVGVELRRSRFPLSAFRFPTLSSPAVDLKRQQTSRLAICAGLFLLLALCFGCVPRERPADLVIINGAEAESLDPALVTAQPDLRVVGALFEGLTRYDPKTGSPIPGLASRWEISPDGLLYRFFLRPGLQWSTGEPIIADDIVYSWIRLLDPTTVADYAGLLFVVTNGEEFNTGRLKDAAQVGVRALDEQTVEVQLKAPAPYFLDICAMPTLAVVPRRFIEQHGDRWLMERPLPVSGAYLLDVWRINDKIRLRRNPRYWDAVNTQSELVDLYPIGSPTVALNLYERGEVDVVWDKELVPLELLETLKKRPDFHSFDYLGSYFIRFNVTRDPFKDVRVRQAFCLGLDRTNLVEKIVKSGGRPASHLIPEGTRGYEPPEGLGYHPEKARQLLAQAGFPGGKGFPRVEYMFNASGGGGAKTHEKIAVEMQEMWRRELGVTVELRRVESKIYFAEQSALQYDFCRSSWIGDYNDPTTFLDLFQSNNGNNRTGWNNAEYDRLLAEAARESHPEQRAQILARAETLLVRNEVPILPLYTYTGLHYYDPEKIEGIYPNLIDVHPIQAIGKIMP